MDPDQHFSVLRQSFDALKHGVVALSIGVILFSLMERLFQLSSARKPWRATLLDVQYAFISMLYPPFVYFFLSAFFGYVALRYTAHNPRLSVLSLGAQFMSVLFVRDCLIYARHRIFHLRPAWAFHSIHHSSEEVNWLSAVRFHPGENIIEVAGELLLFAVSDMVGADPAVLSAAGLVIGFYNFFIHSNQRWTFGPLRYILVSPVFHRWHHSDTPKARDKNFAAMFSCIDLVFGTFYMPKIEMPETVGLSAEEKVVHPRSLTGQLIYPFTKR